MFHLTLAASLQISPVLLLACPQVLSFAALLENNGPQIFWPGDAGTSGVKRTHLTTTASTQFSKKIFEYLNIYERRDLSSLFSS